ncbi:DNA-3-methyladenine glycosylase isoform X2 [Ahaetulla prasina]|uniref:DNA-3-methyladenine glycosylase isoform X2 n=1 Tax=Ahaetulla prasina TaxID=499056 RepID=UPI002648D79B|nr:DNA-3-methyladenine glycosylase isoform X2 [Ahaetulla prasina]XP_058013340.1 DNA-3-methyladenine glycosylase isoform X2 [Ahaetulla prasina]
MLLETKNGEHPHPAAGRNLLAKDICPFSELTQPMAAPAGFTGQKRLRPDASRKAAMLDAPRALHSEAARKPGSGSPARLGAAFFDQPCVQLAKALLGQVSSSAGGGGMTGGCKGAPSQPGRSPTRSKGVVRALATLAVGVALRSREPADVRQARPALFQILVRRLPDGRELRGRIVETEAYLGGEDTASHSRGGRRTVRNAAMFMRPGTLYVYQIYGIYFCMNVSSQGEGAAVLLRSLEPLHGLEAMRELRLVRQQKAPARTLKDWHLCNGPAKLCQALAIDRSFDQQDLSCNSSVWLEPGLEASGDQVPICAPRIGISGEWAKKPLRFYLQGNKCVSVIDKNAEGKLPRGAITEKCV